MSRLTATIRKGLDKRWVLTAFDIAFVAFGIASLIYAVATATQNGIDFLNFYKSASGWVEGVHSNEGGALSIYPPFSVPIFAPLALVSFERARMIWLGINLLAAGTSIYLVQSYFDGWPTRAKCYLALMMLSWAPFRVTIRVGQISLIITALLLGTLVARSRKKSYLAGMLLGVALCKFTLSLPFFLYFAWKREWKILTAAISLIVILTELYALRLGLTLVDVVREYATILRHLSTSSDIAYIGSTEIKPLLIWLTRGDDNAANILLAVLVMTLLIVVAIVFARRPEAERVHFSILALFALWAVYHRTYDSVLYILPVALLIDFVIHKKLVSFSVFWLVATGLLVISVPGLLTSRMGISEVELTQSLIGFVAVHIERVLTFGMFVSLLFVLWKRDWLGSERGLAQSISSTTGTNPT